MLVKILVACSFILYVKAALNGLTVATTEGLVLGTLVDPNVRQFLGIPFAADTSGKNRFRPPQLPPTHPTSIFNATKFGLSCPQNLIPVQAAVVDILRMPVLPQSEDCLSLNIWAPAIGRKQKTAVLLWVYGGGFQIGSSDTTMYIGENFVKNNNDITLVSINYRLNILASPAAPQLVGQVENFGLLDIDASIQWVVNNIAAFGGDPNRISIFCESAGAIAVDSYAFSHIGDTHVKGIITESGTAFIATSTTNATEWNTVAEAVGCGTSNDAAQFACMQKVPFQKLESVLVKENLTFDPVPDGITIFSDVLNRSATGQFLRVPLLTGSNADEGDLLILIDELLTNMTFPDFNALSKNFTDTAILCPAALQSANRVQALVPTFRYRYEGVFPDISTVPQLRAFHGSEISMVFGSYNLTAANVPATPDQMKLSGYMQSVWVQFARDPARGLLGSGFNWPLYNPLGGNTLAEFGSASNSSGVYFANTLQFDSVCLLLAQ